MGFLRQAWNSALRPKACLLANHEELRDRRGSGRLHDLSDYSKLRQLLRCADRCCHRVDGYLHQPYDFQYRPQCRDRDRCDRNHPENDQSCLSHAELYVVPGQLPHCQLGQYGRHGYAHLSGQRHRRAVRRLWQDGSWSVWQSCLIQRYDHCHSHVLTIGCVMAGDPL